MNQGKLQLFVNVDAAGNIKGLDSGENIVMSTPFHYCFLVDEATVDNITKYKVTITDMVPELVLK